MKIRQWGVGDNPHDKGGVMAMVTKKEAIKLIRSLAYQLETGDYNYHRSEFFDDKGKTFSVGLLEDEVIFRGEKITQDKGVVLGGCYHTGLVYSLGYDANGEVELSGETFTNLDTGINGGVVAALRKHREQFDPTLDVEQFIVALKPVKVILGRKEDEDYGLGDNAGCDSCGTRDCTVGEILCDLCEDCVEQVVNNPCFDEEDDTCDDCGEWIEDCICENDEPCDCGDEFCREFVVDQFKPMNAFARAKYLRSQQKEN